MGTGIEDVSQVCKECNQQCKNRRSLGNHVARSHKSLGDLKMYVLKHLLKDQMPKCLCGCGNDVEWHKSRYRFNDYLTGHNPVGFKVKQPVFTKEQIDARNVAIRNAYTQRGIEIKTKLSQTSTLAAVRRKENGFDFAAYFLNKWSDDTFRSAQRDGSLRSWSGEEGELRRIKVFTPALSAKISAANMRRDIKKESAIERLMYQDIVRVFPDAVRSKWFNFSTKTWCADVWVPSHNAIIEFDGTYWHGLDRDHNFTRDQLSNITNDIIKNALALSKGLTLIRIKEGADLSCCTDFEQLLELAYHVVIEGTIKKEGTFRLHETLPLISRETLLTMNKSWIEDTLLPTLTRLYQVHVAYWGWFYPGSDHTLLASIEALEKLDEPKNEINSSLWLKAFVRSFWDVDGGPVKAFTDENTLKNVLRYRLGLNNSKFYKYPLPSGDSIEAHETFDINVKNVRRGFIVQRKAVSWFQPGVAAGLYKRFLHDIRSPVVWDPSIGFSARLLGFAGAFKSGTYVGTDPATMMFSDAEKLRGELLHVRPELNVKLHNVGSETFIPDECSLDLVFTSPPYFDKEKYVDEPGQCWRDHPTLEKWTKGYVVPTIRNAFMGLRPGRKLVFNVSSNLVDILITAALSVGFVHETSEAFHVRPDHFAKKTGRIVTSDEKLLVFVKPV